MEVNLDERAALHLVDIFERSTKEMVLSVVSVKVPYRTNIFRDLGFKNLGKRTTRCREICEQADTTNSLKRPVYERDLN